MRYSAVSEAYWKEKSGEAIPVKEPITVKFLHRGYRRGRPADGLLRLFPKMIPHWGKCHFVFDLDCRDYDWLVVYHDLPKGRGGINEERLDCPREKTLLVTGEPSSITVFGRDYLSQFGHILTFQESWAVPHPRVIFHHPGLIWHYGLNFTGRGHISWDEMAATPPGEKKKLISTVCSARRGHITLHSKRVAFTQRLVRDLPEMDVFGQGVNPIDDKAQALDDYKYHITIENHVHPHHLTEKLPDAFLGYTLPFYHGAPNAGDYFPKQSFIAIDINDYERTRDIINYHLKNNEYEDRLPYIIEARRRVLEEQSLFAILSRVICRRDNGAGPATQPEVICNRRALRMKKPLVGLRNIAEKGVIKTYHLINQHGWRTAQSQPVKKVFRLPFKLRSRRV